ncbi:uncharacterized protein RCC_07736 [Ramularia collo-cygni]|uniref:Uncharacterized protein n=1 Tax=Ramularia collo-cygni TaxID=112498 RepID=A0A2D3V8V5_9PEZI|nr:uncharacterized protein RCC_07736 [Ramularia collo-cygni]CZT21870.1 uncharacterized protein RCC_07736 [Ramularia collo-cygni]
MAQPVLVKAYTDRRASTKRSLKSNEEALPPVSAFTFANILRTADTTPEFQAAIDGIAEICAKNRMSLADEYASHLPPLGEITAATSTNIRPHLLRPGVRRPLTSVPEGSSGSSEGSGKSRKKGSIFSFRKQQVQDSVPARRLRIGMMGRTVPVGSTTALAAEAWIRPQKSRSSSESTIVAAPPAAISPLRPVPRRTLSAAEVSLQQLLTRSRSSDD